MLALKTNGISSTTPTGTLTIGRSRYCQGPCMVATSESDEWTDDAHGAYTGDGGGGRDGGVYPRAPD